MEIVDTASMPFAGLPLQSEQIEQRTDFLFEEHRLTIFKRTDKIFVGLMLFQWLAGIVVAWLISPTTWAGASSQTHPHIWAALFLGGAITLFPMVMGLTQSGKPLTRHTIAVGQVLMSALLIHLS